LEAGAGRGQLTVPLAKRIPRDCRLYAVDSYQGPYREDFRVLRRVLRSEKLVTKVVPLVGDATDPRQFRDGSFDIIVSNELFCELKRPELRAASGGFFRVLKTGGRMAHGNLSPIPKSSSQRLLVEMDSSSKWSTSPARGGWFSPTPTEVASIFHEAGFTVLRTVHVDMNIHYGGEEAKRQLRIWHARPSFLRDHSRTIERQGLDIPPEYITFCRKPKR
jgi:ubiquinone/menaquinone biosynthesis C-methylase UbiE